MDALVKVKKKPRVRYEPQTGRYVSSTLHTLYLRWRKPIRIWLSHRNIPNYLLDDMVQEVFVKMLRYVEMEEVENFQGYLFRTATNIVNEWEERAAVRKPHIVIEPKAVAEFEELIDYLGPESEIGEDQIVSYIHSLVDRLPTRRMKLFIKLHFEDGLTYKEIVKKEGCTYRTVLRDFVRAYKLMRLMIEEDKEL